MFSHLSSYAQMTVLQSVDGMTLNKAAAKVAAMGVIFSNGGWHSVLEDTFISFPMAKVVENIKYGEQLIYIYADEFHKENNLLLKLFIC